MRSAEDISSVWIDGNKEIIWDAITDENKLIQWYAPGSPWDITNLQEGKKVTFTLMPNVHNQLSEKFSMTLTIERLIPYQEFSLMLDSEQILISFLLVEEDNGTRVTINSAGFNESLANLKSLIEGNEIPFK